MRGGGADAAGTPPLISWLMVRYGWRLSFYVTGAASLALSLVWWIEGADSPERTSRISASNDPSLPALGVVTDSTKKATLKAVLANKSLWILSIGYMFDS